MKKIIVLLSIVIFAGGCEKTEENRCEGLKIAVKNDDTETVKEVVTRLAADLKQMVTTEDASGHYNNFQTLIDRLNDECGVVATEVCYGCIYTLPATSEIKLVVPLGTHSVTRIIDITTNQGNTLVCSNMHE